MSPFFAFLLILLVVIILIILFFGTQPTVDPLLNSPELAAYAASSGNTVSTPSGNSQFMAHKAQNFHQYQPTCARLTNYKPIPNTKASNESFNMNAGVYTVPHNVNKMTLWGRCRFDNNIPVSTNQVLPQLHLMKNGNLLNKTDIPVSSSRNGYYIPRGKYDVDYTGQLNKGDKITYEISAPSEDVSNIAKGSLGNSDTSFGGV
jgi:hypothetical protein